MTEPPPLDDLLEQRDAYDGKALSHLDEVLSGI
jgi:hypothetical protein